MNDLIDIPDTTDLRLINDFSAVYMAIEVLEDPASTPAERATASRIGRHRLKGAAETIRRLARSQESALGKRLAG